ncbi:transmembrane protein 218 [Cuculus canorus]|uniref:transmembrane protein 218 n=1 Tax=Cuculus canorus TaxID=55661 RepID=UPI0023AA6744|nr:transmembrane protein 218 [Cuculus canorus]
MAGTALGPGVLLLPLLWAPALLLALALPRAARRARSAALAAALGAAGASAALLLWPRGQQEPASSGDREIVDTFLIGRFILLATMSLIFLGCLFLLLIYHLMEPVYAKPLHSR